MACFSNERVSSLIIMRKRNAHARFICIVAAAAAAVAAAEQTIDKFNWSAFSV